VKLWSLATANPVLVENSDPASSIFIKIGAFDKMLHLTWNEETPWVNTSYTIYRYDEHLAVFDSIGVTKTRFYDDHGLENGKTYCYYIRSEGGYFLPDTLFPLLNRSQENCNAPIDTIPPELPTVTVSTDCETIKVAWNYPERYLYEDVGIYTIYYKASYGDEYKPLIPFKNPGNDCFYQDCSYIIEQSGLIIGCFALTVTDTAGNESALSEATCFDYDECTQYELPNIFTPNGDGINDFFVPFPYKNISKVSMTVYNRWGRIVFTTEDPDIQWDGRDRLSHQPCSEGQYYYACDVFIETLSGRISKSIHGSLTLLR
jgi:gliding motility-associated-like protein